MSRKLGLRAGAQFKKLVQQQEKENLGSDTHRDVFVMTRTKGESVRAQEAAGERVSNRMRASSEQVRQSVSKHCIGEYAAERLGYCINTILDSLTVSLRVLEVESGNTEQTPKIDDVQISTYRSHVGLFFSQDRADITLDVNELCQRMSDPSQKS